MGIINDEIDKGLSESLILFISIFKWSILATFVGILVGLSTSIFLKALNFCISFTNKYSYYYLLAPVAFFLSALTIKYLAPEAEGHGTEKVIEAVHHRSGKINIMVIPVKLIASVITIAFGGSAGKEGPCAQIGGGVSSLISDILRLDDIDRKKIVICGISAGFASVFGTPIAGAIFGIEVLYIGEILYDVLLPSFIAGITSYHVSALLGVKYFYHPLKFNFVLSEYLIIKVIIAGIFFGLVSSFFIEIMKIFKNLSNRIKLWEPLKGLLGGLILIILTFLFSEQFLGLGLETIQSALDGRDVIWYAFILKIIFTSVTLNFFGSGGVVTPIFFVGATAGTTFNKLIGMDISTASAIGLVSVLAGATNAPIASSIMAIELFGASIAPYAALSCIVSFLITGHRSIYPSQILEMKKSSSIQVEIGKEVEEVKPIFRERDKSLINTIEKIAKKVKKKTIRNKKN